MNKKQVVIKSNRKNFFRYWMTLTRPFHKLRVKEQDVLALLLFYYYEYKKKINDERLVWKMVFDYDTKIRIKEELNIKDGNFQNLMTSLRKNNAIIHKKYFMINPAYIPRVSKVTNRFDITFSILISEKFQAKNKRDSSKA